MVDLVSEVEEDEGEALADEVEVSADDEDDEDSVAEEAVEVAEGVSAFAAFL